MTREEQQEPLHVRSHLGEMSARPAPLWVWPIRAKGSGGTGGGAECKSEESLEEGKGGDLLTHHQVNTLGLGAEMRWRGDAGLDL